MGWNMKRFDSSDGEDIDIVVGILCVGIGFMILCLAAIVVCMVLG